jgi:DNA-binding NarL/FixJ family response regulator
VPSQSRAVAFDLDAASLTSLRQAVPGWEVEAVNGATRASVSRGGNPGPADLFVVQASGEAAETLALCRFLNCCGGVPADDPLWLHRSQQNPARRADAPVLVLVPPGQDALVAAALEAGAVSCLALPVRARDVARMVARARQGSRPGRHRLNLDQAQSEDRWRDDGGQG